MKAYLLRKAGKPGVLTQQNVNEPSPSRGQVKIKIRFIGINYAEILARKGQYGWAPKKPYIPGMEGVGEIVEVGENIYGHKPGDKVIFGSQYGSYAEYITVPGYMAFPTLSHLSQEENAAYLVNFMTAWVGLFKLGHLQPGEKVLIQAAAGGVGTAAVQLAKKLGCTVCGTAGSDEKLALLRQLGVDLPINYRREDFAARVKEMYGGADVVLEVVGGEVFRKSFDLLLPFGRLIVAGYASIPFKKWNPFTWWPTYKNAPRAGMMKMAKKSVTVGATHIGYLTKNQEVVATNWTSLKQFVEQHEIKPMVGKTFDFDELPEAHAWIESRKSVGKVVVRV